MDNDLGVRKTVMLNKVYEELLSVTKGVSSYNIDAVSYTHLTLPTICSV